jgi:hypothetical protein
LKLHHQFDQLVLAQALQISAIHTSWIQRLESVARGTRKSAAAPQISAPEMGVGNYPF